MLRAGLIQQVAAGIYAYLPLAWRSMQKIEQIVREEMDAAGSQELRMPALQPMELWEQSGRAAAFGDNMFSLEDRRGRPLALAPTHEEVVTNIVKGNVQSYRDLPVILYQMQTKFRDEPRPRAGLVRVREFTMKDAYSFDADDSGLDMSYQAMAQAYRNVFRPLQHPRRHGRGRQRRHWRQGLPRVPPAHRYRRGHRHHLPILRLRPPTQRRLLAFILISRCLIRCRWNRSARRV